MTLIDWLCRKKRNLKRDRCDDFIRWLKAETEAHELRLNEERNNLRGPETETSQFRIGSGIFSVGVE